MEDSTVSCFHEQIFNQSNAFYSFQLHHYLVKVHEELTWSCEGSLLFLELLLGSARHKGNKTQI